MPLSSSTVATTSMLFTALPGLADFTNDARWVAFIRVDAGGKYGLYLQDTNTGTVRQIATPADASSLERPIFSNDGNKLVFSAHFGLNQSTSLYLYDLRTNQVQLASSDSNGQPLQSLVVDARLPDFDLSGDGRYLVFTAKNSGASPYEYGRVYMKDLQTGTLSQISDNPLSGQMVYGALGNPGISDDGRYVLFFNDANFGPYNQRGWYMKDLQTGNNRLVNTSEFGDVLFVDGPYSPFIMSDDGSKVAFNTQNAMYVKDLVSGKLINATDLGGGIYTNGAPVSISGDGRFLIFNAYSQGQVVGDSNAALDVYLKDLQTGQVELLTPHGSRSDAANLAIQVSHDGQSILYATVNNSSRDGVTLNIGHLNQMIANNQGSDTLPGTFGADQLAGANGNDTYWVNHPGDIVTESANAGTDLVYSVLQNYTLPVNVENLVLNDDAASGIVNPNGNGNNGNNRIEGNSQSNILRGFGGDDTFITTAGNDTIDGGTGYDKVIYTGHMTYGAVQIGTAGVQVNSGGRVDQLQNIERLEFDDQGFALPGDTHAAQVYRVYQAAFNRTPDAGGLGFWIKQADNGVQLSDIANGFIHSQEFRILYGNAPGHVDLVSKFYQNVLHRAPDAGGLNFWVNTLDSGRADAQTVLAQFAESPENQAALAGVIDHGFSFTLFQ